jgi:dienelactone hydrolase
VAAALEFLRAAAPTAPTRYGAVGFGAGGLVSLAAGYRCQIGASVSFYAEGPMRLRANLPQIFDRPKPQAAPLLCLVGALEEVLPADLAAIRAHLGHFGMRETMVVYPRRKTGFCHPASEAYRETEAGDAWGRLLRALDTAPRQRHRFFSKSAAT